MFCKKCGNNLPEGVRFCKKCGNKVESKTSAPAASSPAAAPAPQHNAPQYNAPQQNAPKYYTPQQNVPQNNAPQYGAPQYNNTPQQNAPQYNTPQQNTPQNNAPQYGAPQYNNMPQQNAPQYNAPQYGMPVLVPPKKPSPLKYILIPTGILAAAAVLITVLVTTVNSNQSVPTADSGYEQQSSGGITGNNNGGNNGGSNGVNTGSNNGVDTGKPFVAGGKEYNLVNAVYSEANGGTVLLFEGTLNNSAIMIVAAATGGFDYPATYNQSSFGGSMEVGVYVVDTNTGACAVGSSSTSGLSGARITTDANMMISVSGTLNSDLYGDVSFSVNGKVTSTSMTNISEKIIAYASYADSGSGGGGGGNGGGLQPTPCQACNTVGDGKCRICHGDGKCHSCVDGMDRCWNCNGTRRCKACGGSTLCPYCGGDGMLYN